MSARAIGHGLALDMGQGGEPKVQSNLPPASSEVKLLTTAKAYGSVSE
jgi:hypothetical protein